MTSSSSPALERGLDTMLIVYSLLQGHPASATCQHFVAGRTGWFTSSFTLLEAYAVLTKVYGVPQADVRQKLSLFFPGPVTVVPLDDSSALRALPLGELHNLDTADAVLLDCCQGAGAQIIATEDSQLAQACAALGIQVETPIDRLLRQQIAAWENTNLPQKGLARILGQVHDWLGKVSPATAALFWSHSGNGSHLP